MKLWEGGPVMGISVMRAKGGALASWAEEGR